MQAAIPIGYRFKPTDEELITHYLLRKVMGEALPWNRLIECDLYGDDNEPWKVLTETEPWEIFNKTSEKIIYVFTRLKKLSKNRIARTAGCGSWKGQSSSNIYDAHNNLIGIKKLLVFMVERESDSYVNKTMNGHWIMHEFSLAGINSLIGGEQACSTYVLCRIKKEDSKCLNGGPSIQRDLEGLGKRTTSTLEEENQTKKMRGQSPELAPLPSIVDVATVEADPYIIRAGYAAFQKQLYFSRV